MNNSVKRISHYQPAKPRPVPQEMQIEQRSLVPSFHAHEDGEKPHRSRERRVPVGGCLTVFRRADEAVDQCHRAPRHSQSADDIEKRWLEMGFGRQPLNDQHHQLADQ